MDAKHIIVLTLMLCTLLVLVAGVILMSTGGALNAKYGNKLMVARVSLQGLTILLVGLLFVMGK